jgi:hypothetical protein
MFDHPYKSAGAKFGYVCREDGCKLPEGQHGNVRESVKASLVAAAAVAAQEALAPPAKVLTIAHPFKTAGAKSGHGCKDCSQPEGAHGVYVDGPPRVAVPLPVPERLDDLVPNPSPAPAPTIPALDFGPVAEWLANAVHRYSERTSDGGLKVCATFELAGVNVPVCVLVPKSALKTLGKNAKAAAKKAIKDVKAEAKRVGKKLTKKKGAR